MRAPLCPFVLFLSVLVLPGPVCGQEVEPAPRVLVEGWTLTEVPIEVVTPTGCCVGASGEVYVIECHTHFPPDDYQGPKQDRILKVVDADGDGMPETASVFFEGSSTTMNLITLSDGWLVLATRYGVLKIRDSNGDGTADEQVVLLSHETPGDYPHNGLGGLTLGPDGRLYVGQGENLGEPYTLVGTDQSQQSGHGEGGNIFSCTTDGEEVRRVATGFWNPFGLAFDGSGRLLAVGNDPDSMPPNRLMHVVPAADFGFQFRFGRAGTHPLQSWNGEFPGTLPIAAATGEAACNLLVEGTSALVTSWGDNRVERFELKSDGASVRSTAEVVIEGTSQFRPVGIARGSDGTIYITDWVDRSYPVHGQGRLWQLKREKLPEQTPLPLSPREQTAAEVTADPVALGRILEAANSDDVFLRQAAVHALAENEGPPVKWNALNSEREKLCLLAASRWRQLCAPQSVTTEQRQSLIRAALQDSSEMVALYAVRWATEYRDRELETQIEGLLERSDVSERLFAGVLASLAYLENGSASRKKRDPDIEQRLVRFVTDSTRPAALRALALRRLPPESRVPTNDELLTITLTSSSAALNRQVVAFLAARKFDNWPDRLAMIARNNNVDSQSRADAMILLAKQPAALKTVIDSLATSRDAVLLEGIQRLQTERPDVSGHPQDEDIDGWLKLVGEGGNPDAGRRVFLQRGCVLCHRHSGRGAQTGPDLTTLAGNMTRRRMLESILQPSREIGPMYVSWNIVTTSGKVRSGFKLDRPGKNGALQYVDIEGKSFEVPLDEIAARTVSPVSLMPKGLQRTMTVEELRDLLAFLQQ
ncbi:MAG: c-type cytochrome [Planctomycetaceae bacterium]|nr:c-type cytochrome [Planctomycetaceae bacterium]